MGFSFDDPYVYAVLLKMKELEDRYVSNSSGTFIRPSRYALMGLNFEEVKVKKSRKTVLDVSYIQDIEEKLENIGVTPVWYDSRDKHHRLASLMDEWIETAGGQPTIGEEAITYGR